MCNGPSSPPIEQSSIFTGRNLEPDPQASRPRVLFLADRRGWAFDQEASKIKNALVHCFDIRIAYTWESPDLHEWPFDVIAVLFWGATYHHDYVFDPARIIKQVASHRWNNEERYGCLSPKEFADRYLRDAATITTLSKRLQDTLAPYRRVIHTPQGVDTARFARHNPRSGPIVFGWAGNQEDPCKGLQDILLPAVGKDFDLRIAGGDLTPDEMIAFYHSIDVLCVASTAEGGPLPLIEGMAAGCFPVAVDVGIVPELVTHRQNGLIVRRSVAAFRAAFQWCRMNTTVIRQLGPRNATQIADSRDIKHTVLHWERTIRHALALTAMDTRLHTTIS